MRYYICLFALLLSSCCDCDNPSSSNLPPENYTLNYEFVGTPPFTIEYPDEFGTPITENIPGETRDGAITVTREVTYINQRGKEFRACLQNSDDRTHGIVITIRESGRVVLRESTINFNQNCARFTVD